MERWQDLMAKLIAAVSPENYQVWPNSPTPPIPPKIIAAVLASPESEIIKQSIWSLQFSTNDIICMIRCTCLPPQASYIAWIAAHPFSPHSSSLLFLTVKLSILCKFLAESFSLLDGRELPRSTNHLVKSTKSLNLLWWWILLKQKSLPRHLFISWRLLQLISPNHFFYSPYPINLASPSLVIL